MFSLGPRAPSTLLWQVAFFQFFRSSIASVIPLNATMTASPASMTSSYATVTYSSVTVTSPPSGSATTCKPDVSTMTSYYDSFVGTQIIPENNCTTVVDDCMIEWVNSCRVSMGSVHMTYWPDKTANGSVYPSTMIHPSYPEITMTSPSVYMQVATVTATNDCGQVGPTYSNAFLSLLPTDVRTLSPYPDTTATTRLGTGTQTWGYLTLSDIENCPSTWASTPTGVALIRPTPGLWHQCNPQIYWELDFKHELGAGYWGGSCGREDGGEYGIADPPSVIQPCTAGDIECLLGPVSTAAPTLPAATSSIFSVPPETFLETSSSVSIPSLPTSIESPTTTDAQTTSPESTALSTPASSSNPVNSGPVATTGSDTELPTSAVASSIVSESGTAVIIQSSGSSGAPSSGPSSSGVGSGAQTTQTAPNSMETTAIVSGTSSPSSTTTVSPVFATVGTEIISAAKGASTIQLDNQTLVIGGSAVTISSLSAVATLGSQGLVVQYINSTQTYGLPSSFTPYASPAAPLTLSPIGNGAIMVNGQTVSIGGDVITIDGDEVVSYGPSGLEVQFPGGGVTTLEVPGAGTAAPSPSALATTTSAILSSSSTGTIHGVNITQATTQRSPVSAASATLSAATSTGIPTMVPNHATSLMSSNGNYGMAVLAGALSASIGALLLM